MFGFSDFPARMRKRIGLCFFQYGQGSNIMESPLDGIVVRKLETPGNSMIGLTM